MIQFNLLPDVKLEYIKARRAKHLVMLGSFVAGAVAVGVAVVLFIGVNVVQKRHLSNLDNDIAQMSSQLQNEEDIDKILTVQNQLNSLGALHDSKPAVDRLGKYLSQVTPNEVTISGLELDVAQSSMKIDGNAGAIKDVNKFIDTLKFTTHTAKAKIATEAENGSQQEPAAKHTFSNVVMASFSRGSDTAKGAVAYSVTLNFDPVIFDIKQDVSLKVPKQISTRSVTERPQPLFKPQPESDEEQ